MLLVAGCRLELGPPGASTSSDRPTVWVYTSIYQEQLDQFAALAATELPGVDVRWYQGGSEKIAQRWEAEHSAGASPACVVATSDPSWFVELARRGLLHAYVSPRALLLPRAWVTPWFAPHRIDLMVIGAPKDGEAPARFTDLAEDRWRGTFSSGDPFSSGTVFTTVSAWDQLHGQPFLERLDANGWVMAGGNSAVLGRIESGEKPIGVVLLNNLLTERSKPGEDSTRIVYPEDGAVPIPGPLAIPTDCREKEAAEDVVDWFMGESAQALVVKGRMHSPFPGAAAPDGAPPLDQIVLAPLPDDFMEATAKRAPDLRARLEALQR
ncbi:MAG: extracellular solute-binding protein [Pseudomonadota bacterium]|nr:extracellular solute-binding protein [Pseudomonadota bacterium]